MCCPRQQFNESIVVKLMKVAEKRILKKASKDVNGCKDNSLCAEKKGGI